MLARLRCNAERLKQEARQFLGSLKPRPDLQQEVGQLFEHGSFPALPSPQLQHALRQLYQRGLGLAAPRILEVQSLHQASEVFRDGPRLPPKAALLLSALHNRSATMSDSVEAWRERVGAIWEGPRAYQTVPVALWSQTLGLVSPSAPRWLFHYRAGRGGLLEQVAGQVLEAGVWCAWLKADEVVALRAPRAVRLNPEGQLHARGGAAIEWADGRRYWAVNGVALPEDFDPAEVNLTRLRAASLREREMLIDLMGYEWLLAEAPCQLRDLDLEPSGYPRRLVEVPLPHEEVVVVVVTCPSTGKNAYLRVPPSMQSCHQAVAWTFGFDESSHYQPWQQT
jgi:hypothetical protein